MSSDTLTSGELKTITLDWFSGDGQHKLVVIPRDQRRFEIQTDEAIRILQIAAQPSQFKRQLELLWDSLGAWIRTHRTKVRHAFLTVQDGCLVFVVVRQEPAYDADFEDALPISIAMSPSIPRSIGSACRRSPCRRQETKRCGRFSIRVISSRFPFPSDARPGPPWRANWTISRWPTGMTSRCGT